MSVGSPLLVDTSAWVELLRQTGSWVDVHLAEALHDGGSLVVTGVVFQEVLQGCRGERHASDLRTLLAACDAADAVYPATYDHAAALYRRCRQAGRAVRGTVDCLVAAVALEHALPVLATDRDFEVLRDVCGLQLLAAR